MRFGVKLSGVKKSIVPFVLGAVVGVGGLMGFQYVSGSEKLSILQHLQGDSTAVPALAADSAAKAAPAPDTLAPVAVDTMPAVAIDTAAMPMADSAAAFPGVSVAPAARDTAGRLAPRRLAKFFGSMQAREAARVLEKMSDSEVETVLTQLSDREAASVLSNLTPERAAQISQVVLSGERSTR
jgi:hypothetical protein